MEQWTTSGGAPDSFARRAPTVQRLQIVDVNQGVGKKESLDIRLGSINDRAVLAIVRFFAPGELPTSE